MLFKRKLFKRKETETFGDPKEFNKKYADSDFSQNLILADGVYKSMDFRKTRKNNNVFVVGGSGNGKTHSVIEPTLLQANCSYVVTSVDKNLSETYGSFLEQEKGYKVKIFDLTDPTKSLHYNPFAYIRNEQDIITMVKSLIENTNRDKQGDPFFESAEAHFLLALCSYLVETMPKEEQHFGHVLELLNLAEIDEEYPEQETALDVLMKHHREQNPESMAVKNYDIFKKAAGKTLKSILISVSVRLQVFKSESIKTLTNDDTLELVSLGDEKQALFIVMPENDDHIFKFLVAMLCTQAFETLHYHAEHHCKVKLLPVHVKFLLDDFANCGRICKLEQSIPAGRQHDISYTITSRSLSQLKAMYRDDWETLIDCCDAFLFLGCQGITTLKHIINSLKCYKVDISKIDWLRFEYDHHGHESITCNMNDNYCLIFVWGNQPMYVEKYNPENHPNFKYTADYRK